MRPLRFKKRQLLQRAGSYLPRERIVTRISLNVLPDGKTFKPHLCRLRGPNCLIPSEKPPSRLSPRDAALACGMGYKFGTGSGKMKEKFLKNRFLFEELVKRDFTKKYKRTILGMGWSIISPLMNLLIMWLVFSKLFGTNVNHYAIYLFSGQLVFSFFTDATNLGMNSLVTNAPVFTRVNVPKYLFLLSQNVSSLINFCLTLVLYFIFAAFDGVVFTWKFLLLAYPILCLIIFNTGLGLVLSALFVFFRDMQYLWGIMTQLLMWLSAIFYTIDAYSYTAQCLFLLNPLYLYIRYFRKIVLDGTIPTPQFHLLAAAYALLAFGAGAYMYKKYNHEFLYYV